MKKITKRLITVSMIVAVIFTLLINMLFVLLGDRINLRIDLTENKVFAIDEQTKQVLKDFESEVIIKVLATEEIFAATSVYNAQANEVIQQFDKASEAIRVEYIDYISDPSIATKYPNLQIKYGDLIMVYQDKADLIATEDLFNYTYGQQGQLSIASSKAEETLLSGLLAITSDEKVSVAVIAGHSEYTMKDFESLLSKNNYEVYTTNLITSELKEGTDVVLMFAPKVDISEVELAKLDDFLENKGNYGKTLVYTGDPSQISFDNLTVFLREWGIVLSSGSVFETDENKVYNYQPFYGIVDYVDLEFVDMLVSDSIPMLAPLSRPIEVVFDARNNYSTRILTQFGSTSGVRPEDAPEDFTSSMATKRGPIPALVLATRKSDGTASAKSSYLLVSGSTAIADTFALTNASFSNSEYLLNVLNTTTNKNQSLRILPKKIVGSSLNLSKYQVNLIGSVFVFIGPLIMLLLAVMVYLKRKNL
jgi:ABC-2 type transport system permease protein